MSLPIGTPNNNRAEQRIDVNPSSGELIALGNYSLPTFDNVQGGNIMTEKESKHALGGDGEIMVITPSKGTSTKDMFSGTTGQLIIMIIGSVIAGLILYIIVRKG